MAEKNTEKLAKQFVGLLEQETIIPLDDQNLGQDELYARNVRRINSPACLKFMQRIEGVLKQTDVSSFLREQIIYECGLEYGSGLTRPNPGVIEDLYGVNFDKKTFGIFDPQIALVHERRYFDAIQGVLAWRMENGEWF